LLGICITHRDPSKKDRIYIDDENINNFFSFWIILHPHK
jgi:hypothetical protein